MILNDSLTNNNNLDFDPNTIKHKFVQGVVEFHQDRSIHEGNRPIIENTISIATTNIFVNL